MIGMLTVHPSPDPDGWMPFLSLLSRPLDEIRASGGVGRLWAATGQTHLSITEIDYADILRDRGKGQEVPKWDDIIRACLNLDSPLDDDTLKNLVDVCLDAGPLQRVRAGARGKHSRRFYRIQSRGAVADAARRR